MIRPIALSLLSALAVPAACPSPARGRRRPNTLLNTSWVCGVLALAGLTLLSAPALAQDGEEGAEEQEAGEAQSADPRHERHGTDLPLEGKTERMVLELDEGSWMSLDVTPDGRQIVFELLGDIYIMPAAGGEARAITKGLGFDTQPRVSPDGEWITFVSDRSGGDNVWIAQAGGLEPRALIQGDHNFFVTPVFTPDSDYVLVSKQGEGGGFMLYHREGGSGVALKAAGGNGNGNGGNGNGGGNLEGIGGSFTPDGRYLYYSAAVPGARFGSFPRYQVYRYDMDTGEVNQVTQGEGGGLRPLVSPDGRWLAYATRHEAETGFRIRNLETGADRWLVWPVDRDIQEGRPTRDLLPGYAFVPDSSALIMSYNGGFHRVTVADGAVTDIPFTATVHLDTGPDLTSPYGLDEGPVTATLIHDPQFSPDGGQIVASVLADLYVMDAADGAAPRRLTGGGEGGAFKPVWSPDGRWIAYVTWTVEGGHIWRMRANGRGTPERLTDAPAFYTEIAWSPDGARIVAMRGNAFQRNQTFSEFGGLRVPLDLIWLPADGGAVQEVLTGTPARHPHFAGGSDRIYFYTGEALESARFDGTDRKVHLQVEGPNPARRFGRANYAQQVVMHPDRDKTLALVNGQVFLVAVAGTGADAPTVNVRGAALPVAQLTDIGADFIGWTSGGDAVQWAIGHTVYRRALDSITFREGEDEDEEDAEESEESEDSSGSEDAAEEEGEEDTLEEEEKEEDEEEPFDPRDRHEAVEAFEMTVTRPRDLVEGTLLIRNVNLIAMEGETTDEMAAVQAGRDVLVENNRIAAIAPAGEINPGSADHVVDGTGRFLVPGFIDTHAHWEFRTGHVLEPHNWSLAANLAYGVTAGLDVQTSTPDYFAYRDMVETGQSTGQRAFMTGPGIFYPNDFQSYNAAKAYLMRYSDHYMTKNIKAYLSGNRKQRQWVILAAQELGLMPTTEGGGDQKLDLTHAIDGMHGNEHTLPDVNFYDDVVQLYARTQTAYTPTLVVQYAAPSAREYFFTRTEVHDDPKLNRFYPHNRLDEMTQRRPLWARETEFAMAAASDRLAEIQRAGGLIGVGGHGEVQGLGYHWEMWAMEMGAMTPAEVLRAATIDGAKIIGVHRDLGSIAVGKVADMVLLEENPFTDIRNTNTVDMVVKGGALYDGDTLNQLWPVEHPLPPFWWWDETADPSGGPEEPQP